MAAIIRDFNATIIKNTGDSLLYYFPKTSNSNDKSAFKEVFECGLTMIRANTIINTKTQEEGLSRLNYRISADYGRVEMAKSMTSTSEDLFGPTVSLCAKINSKVQPNGMVMGNALYLVTKNIFDDDYYYNIAKLDEYSIDEDNNNNPDNQYPVYSVASKDRTDNDNMIELYKNIVSVSNTFKIAFEIMHSAI
jgi:two-component system, OmpR family, response regulator ChvI